MKTPSSYINYNRWRGQKSRTFFNVWVVVYFASDRVPNVGGGLVRPIAQAPKLSAGVAETRMYLGGHVDTVGGSRHVSDGANSHEHKRHDTTLPAPNASQLSQ